MRFIVPYCLPTRATTCSGTLNVAKVQYKLRVAFVLILSWYGSMEWNMEENFSMEWNMEWKIFNMEWKKIARREYAKIVFHSIPYQALVANGLPPLQYFFEKAVLPGRNDTDMGIVNLLYVSA